MAFKNLSESEFLNRNKLALGITGVLLLLPAFVVQFKVNPWIGVIGLPMFSLGSGLLLLAILKTDLSRVPLTKSIAYTGSFSYSIYLWHVPVLRWLPNLASFLVGKLNWFVYFAVTFVATMLIGALMAKIIEYPFLRIRNRYFPTLSPPLVQNLSTVTCQPETRIATADLDAS